MSLSPKSQVMFASAFSWIADSFVFLGFIFFLVTASLRCMKWNFVCKSCGRRERRTWRRAWSLAIGQRGRRHNYVGVSLQEMWATMQVMLGVSLRARWDATLVITNQVTIHNTAILCLVAIYLPPVFSLAPSFWIASQRCRRPDSMDRTHYSMPPWPSRCPQQSSSGCLNAPSRGSTFSYRDIRLTLWAPALFKKVTSHRQHFSLFFPNF